MAAAQSLTVLPIEIIEAILLHLDAHALVAVSETSKRCHAIINDASLVWRHRCRNDFKFWADHHDMPTKFAGPLSNIDWRALFIQRVRSENEAAVLLDQVLETQHNRIAKIDSIAHIGYDAKELLLREALCPDEAEDVLARRYFATAILGRIQRERAIKVWAKINYDQNLPLEVALSTFDVFVRIGEEVDYNNIAHDFDLLASNFLEQNSGFADLSTRAKAAVLVTWLRNLGFRGVSGVWYHALRNSFIGVVMQSPQHESLPLLSVAIFCAIAHRVGLDARPCGFLYHVYSRVYAPKDYDLDGTYKPTSSTTLASMYIDPFRSAAEVPRTNLEQMLREAGATPTQREDYLGDARTRTLVLRTARNILNAVQTARRAQGGAFGIMSAVHDVYPDLDNSFYAAVWAMLMIRPDDQPDLNETISRRRFLPYLLEQLRTHYPWDLSLVKQYVVPLFSDLPQNRQLLDNVLTSAYQADASPKTVRRRATRASVTRYKVGILFQHKRYGYEAVITGWDSTCGAREDWIENMGIDRLARGRDQSFYHVFVCDKSVRYVAEENILLLENPTPSTAMLNIAGRHFKRWDDEAKIFVSNVRDEYPDD